MDQLTKARLESKPIELADRALAAIKRRSPESGNSSELAEWQRDVNAAAELRRVVGEFVHGMPDEYGPLDLIDNIISCQSIWAMPSQTELIQLRNEVAKLVEDKKRLDSRCIAFQDRDEFGEPCNREYTGMNLRAAIDAAMRSNARIEPGRSE